MLKRNISKLLRRKRFYFSLALLGLLLWAYSSLEMRMGDQSFTRLLSDNPFNYEAEFEYHEADGRILRSLSIGHDTMPLIVFIHGAPASSAFWRDMLRDSMLLSKARLMAVDRPGYGYSGYGKPLISVKKQAALIAEVIRKKAGKQEHVVVHGSSYGGTVAARLAMDNPDLVDGLLLQSSSLKPKAEKTYWISYPTHHWALRWMMPGSIRTANAEKLSHHLQLRDMVPHWKKIKAASIILHGTADELIYPDNATFAYNQLTNARFKDLQMIPDRKHDLLWTKTDLLKESLVRLVSARW